MPTAKIFVTATAPFEFEFDHEGQPFRPLCLEARDNESHPLHCLYKRRRHIDWSALYIEGEPTPIDDLELHSGMKIFFCPRITGSGGGKGAFASEMMRRLAADMSDPFITDEERQKFASRCDESVWEEFWEKHGGSPPCLFPLSDVQQKDETAA